MPFISCFGQKFTGIFIETHLGLSERIAIGVAYERSTLVRAPLNVLSLFEIHRWITFFTAKTDERLRFQLVFLGGIP